MSELRTKPMTPREYDALLRARIRKFKWLERGSWSSIAIFCGLFGYDLSAGAPLWGLLLYAGAIGINGAAIAINDLSQRKAELLLDHHTANKIVIEVGIVDTAPSEQARRN